MTERWDKRLLDRGIPECDGDRLRRKQVNEMRDTCRDTPEQFREMVQKAVEIQMQAAFNDLHRQESGKKAYALHRPNAEDGGTGRRRNLRRKWRRIFLPAAAILAAGSMAVAAGSGWLRSRLMERGFTESEAEALLETELQQQITELAGAVFPSGETMEKEWSAPLLTVREACFDGNALYFLAEGSEEASDYDLYLRDHASVNGKDGLTSLEKLEGEGTYLGQIDLLEDGSEIMQASAVDVDMIIVPYPQPFEGITLYTWKDTDAYRQIFGSGTFEDEYGRPCRVISRKDDIAGYTPQKLSMQVPLTEEAKQIIEEYRRQGKMEAENPAAAVPAENDLTDSAKEREYSAGETGYSAGEGGDGAGETGYSAGEAGYSAGEAGDGADEGGDGAGETGHSAESGDTDEPGQTEQSKKDRGEEVSAYDAEGTDGEHVSCELAGKEGSFRIDALVVRQAEEIYTGTLQVAMASEEALKALYTEGDPKQWELTEDTGYYSAWSYPDKLIFARQDIERLQYDNDEPVPWEEQSGKVSPESEENRQEEEICLEILESLGIEAQMTEAELPSYSTSVNYILKPVLENLPVAEESQWYSKCIVTLEDGYLRHVSAPGRMEILEKEQAVLPRLGDILQSVEKYAAAGEIQIPYDGQPVTEISLEYYVDLTAQGIVFRPVWNFRVPYLAEGMDYYSVGAANFLYIDALTGALIRDVYGW